MAQLMTGVRSVSSILTRVFGNIKLLSWIPSPQSASLLAESEEGVKITVTLDPTLMNTFAFTILGVQGQIVLTYDPLDRRKTHVPIYHTLTPPALVYLHLFTCTCSPALVHLHLFTCTCLPALLTCAFDLRRLLVGCRLRLREFSSERVHNPLVPAANWHGVGADDSFQCTKSQSFRRCIYNGAEGQSSCGRAKMLFPAVPHGFDATLNPL